MDPKEDLGSGAKSPIEDALPWFVQSGLKAIVVDRRYAPIGATVKVVCSEKISKPVFCLPILVDEDGEIDARLLFARADDSTYPRRACFAEVLSEATHQRYFLIIEGQSPRKYSTIMPIDNIEGLSISDIAVAIAILETS